MADKEDPQTVKKSEPAAANASPASAPGKPAPPVARAPVKKTLLKTAKDKVTLLQMAEISIWLDTYDDVFSDFDPRPYTQRTMSDDFINAAKNEIKETSGGKLEMILMIPEKMRATNHEDTIRKRIRDYFKNNFDILAGKTLHEKRWGYLIFGGGILSIFASSLVHMMHTPIILQNLLYSIFEPMGFFMLFTGLDQVISASKNKENIEFYRKIAEGNIRFIPY